MEPRIQYAQTADGVSIAFVWFTAAMDWRFVKVAGCQAKLLVLA